jgi:biopolymer transport protein ExbD
VIAVTKQNEISVNGRRVSSDKELKTVLERELAKSTDKTVIFEGDKDVFLGEAVKVLEIAQEQIKFQLLQKKLSFHLNLGLNSL